MLCEHTILARAKWRLWPRWAPACPRWPAPDCVWLLLKGHERMPSSYTVGMTLMVTNHEVAGRYLNDGRWIRRESGMERRAHRFAAMGRVLSLDLLYISPGDSTDAPEGVARSQREVQFKPWPERNGKGKQSLLAGTEIE
jgi:hypothetical protein